jgi:hypothetical protein
MFKYTPPPVDPTLRGAARGKAILAYEQSQPGYAEALLRALNKEEYEWRDNYLAETREVGTP